MPLPISGGGYQFTDGNANEVQLLSLPTPPTATATTTLTIAQVTGGILVGNPSTTAATYTMPTAQSLDDAIVNARIGSAFELRVINLGTSTGAITVAAGTGITTSGNMVVAITSSTQFTLRKTGAAAWTLYRTA